MVFSIFSNYLEPLGVKNCEETKPSDVYNQLRNAYNQGVKGIVENARILSSGTADESDILYEVWRNPRLHDILVWINKKIVLELGKLDYRAIDVRIRIATNMLNKLESEGYISKNFNIDVHDRFIMNVRREISAINVEDLPF